MTMYCQITYRERLRLHRGLRAGRNLNQIACDLGRHRSTIYRELRRNGSGMLGYLTDRAARPWAAMPRPIQDPVGHEPPALC